MEYDTLITSEIQLDLDTVSETIFSLIRYVRPEWSESRMIVERFKNGITNCTFGIFQLKTVGKEFIDETDGLVLKIFGKNASLVIDREKEICVMKLLSEYQLSNRILLKFANGYLSSYIPGQVCNCQQISSDSISLMIAKKMAHYHSLPLETRENRTNLIENIRTLAQSLTMDTILHSTVMTDLSYLEKFVLPYLKLDIVLCHNDLLPANIIYEHEKNDVFFIDFEFCSYNYWLYDIANHFGEYTDYFNSPDIDAYPSRDFQKRWLTIYLDNRKPAMQTLLYDLDQLCDLIDLLTALAHLFWSLWLFNQMHSNEGEKFDYEKYARMRFEKYMSFKTFLYNERIESIIAHQLQ